MRYLSILILSVTLSGAENPFIGKWTWVGQVDKDGKESLAPGKTKQVFEITIDTLGIRNKLAKYTINSLVDGKATVSVVPQTSDTSPSIQTWKISGDKLEIIYEDGFKHRMERSDAKVETPKP